MVRWQFNQSETKKFAEAMQRVQHVTGAASEDDVVQMVLKRALKTTALQVRVGRYDNVSISAFELKFDS